MVRFMSCPWRTGALRWRAQTGGPLLGDATVEAGVVRAGSADGRIYALDATTGRALWGRGVLTQGATECQPAVAEGRGFVGSSDGRAYAVAIAAGAGFWRCSTADAVYAQTLVIHGTVYTASSDQTLTAVDALSGRTAQGTPTSTL